MISLLLLANLITLTTTRSVCFEPCDVTIVLSVQPERDNSELRLEMIQTDGAYYRSSSLDMSPNCDENGKCVYPPQRMRITYPRVPEGAYVITATLLKHDAKTWIAGEAKSEVTVR